jgi:hypothetical protein
MVLTEMGTKEAHITLDDIWLVVFAKNPFNTWPNSKYMFHTYPTLVF